MALVPGNCSIIYAPKRPSSAVRVKLAALLAVVGLLLAACSPEPFNPLESQPLPVITVTDHQGHSLSGTVSGTIVISVTPLEHVEEVRFGFGGEFRSASLNSGPLQIVVDTREFPNGAMNLTATLSLGIPPGQIELQRVLTIRNSNLTPGPPSTDDHRLTWAPPTLVDAITVHVPEQGGVLNLDVERDYQVVMPDMPVTGGVAIRGGRNVVMIGGEISIPLQAGDNLPESARRGLFIVDNAGVVHIEGLYIHGDDLGEGIQISARNSVVQVQNVRIWGIHARDQVGFSDAHPDLIQTWGNVGELRIDKLTGKSDYQGFFFKADMNGRHGDVTIKRVNVHGDATARYLFWMSNAGGAYPTVSLSEFYVQPAPGRSLGKTVWPDIADRSNPASVHFEPESGAELASWASLPVAGFVQRGQPINGDFVTASEVGIYYQSPGYL